eukprot:CAMPEP_0174834628 /NCGR_PEP_ID=MMETSP1114-20130205/4941_1 /TAXON_ID=312471 /ORGANISM="Neobodo designis, Strain CCAP 1951/1" /LENGTH=228 /DNA_ID=CAMNT_0016068549 /DNA_START=48 /DNA_END=734 /DNA_ORIENTATION=-
MGCGSSVDSGADARYATNTSAFDTASAHADAPCSAPESNSDRLAMWDSLSDALGSEYSSADSAEEPSRLRSSMRLASTVLRARIKFGITGDTEQYTPPEEPLPSIRRSCDRARAWLKWQEAYQREPADATATAGDLASAPDDAGPAESQPNLPHALSAIDGDDGAHPTFRSSHTQSSSHRLHRTSAWLASGTEDSDECATGRHTFYVSFDSLARHTALLARASAASSS